MTYNSLRIGRTSIPGQTYVVTIVTANRRPLFGDVLLGRIVVRAMQVLDDCGAGKTLAFAVMPDHIHWLFELSNTHSLSQAVKLLKGRTATDLRKHLNKAQRIWQPSFHDHGVRTDESLIEIVRYIVMNPVRAGLVARIGDYPLWDCVWMM